jgi:heptaprenyl diphosphate synthase
MRTQATRLSNSPQPLSLDEARSWARVGVLAALALVLSYIETFIPLPVPVPGIKLGLANLVIIIAIYRMGFRYSFTINMVRIVAAGLLFSGVFGMIYSLAGGILSIIVMYLLCRTNKFSMVGVSMAGGVCHNLGQLMTAVVLLQNTGILSYFPVLLFSGLISGILIGILDYIIEKRLPAFTD